MKNDPIAELKDLVRPLHDALMERGRVWDLDLLTRVVLDPFWILHRISALNAHEINLSMPVEGLIQNNVVTPATGGTLQAPNGRVFWWSSNCCSEQSPEAGHHERTCEVARELRDTIGPKEVQRQADGSRALAAIVFEDEMIFAHTRQMAKEREIKRRNAEANEAAQRVDAALTMQSILGDRVDAPVPVDPRVSASQVFQDTLTESGRMPKALDPLRYAVAEAFQLDTEKKEDSVGMATGHRLDILVIDP